MTRPIIVAIDPYRDDDAPAALGRLLAELLDAPLVPGQASDPIGCCTMPRARWPVVPAGPGPLAGGTSHALVRRAACPVIVVPADAPTIGGEKT